MYLDWWVERVRVFDFWMLHMCCIDQHVYVCETCVTLNGLQAELSYFYFFFMRRWFYLESWYLTHFIPVAMIKNVRLTYIYNAGQLTFSQFTLRQARFIPTCMKNSFGLPFKEGHWVSEKCSIKVSISNMPSLTPKIESHCQCIVLPFRRWPWDDTTITKLVWPLWSMALTGRSKRFQMRRGRMVIMRARWEGEKRHLA